MWRGVTAAQAFPHRREHGPRRLALGRQDGRLPDPQRHRRPRHPARELGRRARRRGAGAARLERERPARRFLRRVPRLALRLARRRRADREHRDRARLPDGRPGPAAALELRPHHAARRRRAPDGAARLERRRPGDPRRPLPRGRAGGARARARGAHRLRRATQPGDGPDRAGQPQPAAGCDPARGARALRRQAVRAHRRPDLAGRAGRDHEPVPASRGAAWTENSPARNDRRRRPH